MIFTLKICGGDSPLARDVAKGRGSADRLMSDAVELSAGRRVNRWRSVSEELEIEQLTLKLGASKAEAEVARAHALNAN